MTHRHRHRANNASDCLWRRFEQFPDLSELCARNPARYPGLFESVAHGTAHSRFDILFAHPIEERILRSASGAREPDEANRFLQALQGPQTERGAHTDNLPFPYRGGWLVYLSYEFSRCLETALAQLPENPHEPLAQAWRCPAAIIRDHHEKKTYVVSERAYPELLDSLEDDLKTVPACGSKPRLPTLQSLTEEDPEKHLSRIQRALEYIRAGDTYQVNISRPWMASFRTVPDPVETYRCLRRANPAPFAGILRLSEANTIISSSPERLVAVYGSRIETRPIAGTWPRRRDGTGDSESRQSLRRDPKERAEHVMLVDLERNDLGRLCRPGTVRADEMLIVENHEYVHHLVSSVAGELRNNLGPADVIRAMFPGGTITGCPKLRSMQIIGELEASPRGAYTGSMGYINLDGSLDFNILIRTLEQQGRQVRFRAGGGIVADSVPDREINETRAKAHGMLAALRTR